MKLSRSEIFEEIPVRQAVAKQVIPSIASQMVALAYNLADTYFVGKINDPGQTAAITIVYPAFLMLTALSNLFGVGGASLIARKLGSKEIDKAKQVSSFCFWSGTLTALLFVLFCAIFAEPILVLCGATIETLPIAYEYAKWVLLIGGIPTILNTMFANLVRSEGSAARASIGVTLGGILNIILDPFFVLPQFLGFGVTGAGMATVISNTMTTIYFLYYCRRNRKTTIIDINPKHLIFWKNHIKGVFSIGIPSALQYALTVVSVGAQSKFVSAYGSQAVAALGITKKLDQLPLYFSIGVSNGLLPLIGYNYAAKKHKRTAKIFRFGSGLSVGFALLCVFVYEVFAVNLASLFIKDQLTITYAAAFLRRMVLAMPFMALCYPYIIKFQGMGKAKESLIVSILRKGVLDIPLLFVMNQLIPLYGLMWVQPMVDFSSLVVALFLNRRIQK